MLILGGIGVSSVTRVFVQQKVKSIAILKCVGSTSHQVLAIYLTQVVLLGLAGSALGVAIAAAALQVLPLFVGNLAELLQVDYGLTAGAVLQGLAIGVLVSLLSRRFSRRVGFLLSNAASEFALTYNIAATVLVISVAMIDARNLIAV